MATNIMGLVDYVQNKGEIGKQQGQQSRLSELASQSYTTPAGQQNALLGQMAQVSPQFAQQQQQQFQEQGDARSRKAAGAAKYVLSAVERGDQAAIQGAYRTVYPYLSELVTEGGGQAPPEQWDPAMAEGLHQILSAAEGGGGASGQGVQSTYVDDQGQRVAIMRDGSTRVLGGNDAGATQQTINITGSDGRPAQYTFNRRTGNYEPATLGGGQPQGQPAPQGQSAPRGQPGMTQVQYSTSDGQAIPANEQAAAQAAFAASARGESFDFPVNGPLPQAPQSSQGRSSFVGRSPDEQAALTTAAQERTELGFLPQRQQIETQGAIERERGVGQVKSQQDRAQAAPKKIAGFRAALEAAGNVRTSIDKSLEMIGPASTGFIGARLRGVEGTPAFNLAAEIETIKANLGFDRLQQMRDNSPTGGALGQVAIQELVALQSTVANLDPNQSAEQLADNINRIEQHYTRWEQAVQQAMRDEQAFAQGGPPQAAQSQPGGWGIQRVD